MAEDTEGRPRGTVAVYDRPQWWRRRQFWRFALPVVAGVGSLAVWYVIFT
ncbi:MAG TPA: hypothetical protein VNE58_16860 [Casimicrobiaceae bacterium]|nr:hypothetical protein [Casimicrobiaceae bacterium]